jgi:hypothetical protein
MENLSSGGKILCLMGTREENEGEFGREFSIKMKLCFSETPKKKFFFSQAAFF